ncbi:MAG: DnaK suppressor protein [Candidatus Moranbacteria bacterium GW2011_GWF2_34_56]|nr:MAG: DnaK suppressor protein [Candidatus Moranbacteria bacterium GW2011_GWF1_34_10]KKP63262.1 MAG: DnaK suppressor protein [Candidatus Moranbacteria bacterium GW2011_GWF2_34_56]
MLVVLLGSNSSSYINSTEKREIMTPSAAQNLNNEDVYTPIHKNEMLCIIDRKIKEAEEEHTLLLESLSEATINASDGIDRAAKVSSTMSITDKLSRNSGRLKKLYHARNKLESVDYGICENDKCGDEIPLKRLRIRPQARFCIPCAEIKEREEQARQQRRR